MFAEVVDELVGLSDTDLVARIEANELERRRLDAEMSAALALADRRNVDGIDGHRSMASFCRAYLNWSTSEAGRRLGLARAVDAVPGLGDAWFDGHIGLSQAQKLSHAHGNKRVRDRLGEFAPLLLDNAEQMPYSDFAITVDYFVEKADEDGAHDDRDARIDGRSARVVAVGGSLDIRATGGDGLTTAEMIAIHDRYSDAEYTRDVDARRAEHGDDAENQPLARTDRQRRFDALIAIFRTAAATDDVGSPADPLVNIAIDAVTWGNMLLEAGLSTSTDLDGRPVDPFTGLPITDTAPLIDDLTVRGIGPNGVNDRRCETSNGVQLHPHDVLQAALAGHVRRVVVDSQRVVIDMGRRQRLFTGNARTAAKMMLRRCEHAGCELPAEWCDVDHDTEWDRDHGPTDQRNARILCHGHNDDKHHRRWTTRRGTNGSSYTIREDGTIVLPVGARPPTFPDDDPDGDDFDSPDEVARLTALTRTRFDELIRNR